MRPKAVRLFDGSKAPVGSDSLVKMDSVYGAKYRITSD